MSKGAKYTPGAVCGARIDARAPRACAGLCAHVRTNAGRAPLLGGAWLTSPLVCPATPVLVVKGAETHAWCGLWGAGRRRSTAASVCRVRISSLLSSRNRKVGAGAGEGVARLLVWSSDASFGCPRAKYTPGAVLGARVDAEHRAHPFVRCKRFGFATVNGETDVRCKPILVPIVLSSEGDTAHTFFPNEHALMDTQHDRRSAASPSDTTPAAPHNNMHTQTHNYGATWRTVRRVWARRSAHV